jgi:hypothetical protein
LIFEYHKAARLSNGKGRREGEKRKRGFNHEIHEPHEKGRKNED